MPNAIALRVFIFSFFIFMGRCLPTLYIHTYMCVCFVIHYLYIYIYIFMFMYVFLYGIS